jgi:hypothetical protein
MMLYLFIAISRGVEKPVYSPICIPVTCPTSLGEKRETRMIGIQIYEEGLG